MRTRGAPRLQIWLTWGVLVCGLAVAPAFVHPTAAGEVVIVTSFPKELFEAYKKAFEARHPGVKVVIRQKNTAAAVTYIRETRNRPDSDLMWASAIDAFLVLKNEGLLQKLTLPQELQARTAPAVAGFPIHDRDGFYFGFAVSGYGLMWNTRYLRAHRLKAPAEWTDLADPGYHGHLVTTAPSRSGTSHLTIEVILQAYGWEKGWGLILNAGGNMGLVTERSFGVPEAVIAGQYGIGPVVDFFGLSAIAKGHPVEFNYPSLTSIVPANVGIIKGAPNLDQARAFVHYLLSDEGQMILFQPTVARLPVVPELYARAPKGYPNPFKMSLGGLSFNPQLSSTRYDLLNSLFDQVITFRLAELRRAWGAIYRAEEALARARQGGREASAAARQVAEARTLATRVPIEEARANDHAFNRDFKAKAELRSKLEREWDEAAKANYQRAEDLARRATQALR